MILDWEKGADNHWQAVLWRKVAADHRSLHPPALAEAFKAVLGRGTAPLPERVSVFGISSLPPFYVEFLEELALAGHQIEDEQHHQEHVHQGYPRDQLPADAGPPQPLPKAPPHFPAPSIAGTVPKCTA